MKNGVSSPLRFVKSPESDVGRRTFLKLLSATAVAAGSAACAGPAGEIVPYVSQPPELVPGVPLHFATSMVIDGYATGVLVESREGRPVKIEGNPAHPASLGAAGPFEQASVLQLYDPDRARFVTLDGDDRGWVDCAAAFSLPELQRIAGRDGAGLRFLLEPTASPITAALIARIHERLPAAQFHFYAPLVTTHAADGAAIAFGRVAEPVFDFRNADVILTADADPFAEGAFHLRYARQAADGRRVRRSTDDMNRLYALEGHVTATGAWADHRLPVRPSAVTGMLASLLREAFRLQPPAALTDLDRVAASAHQDWIRAVAQDVVAHRGRAVVVVGDRQPPLAHALGYALNHMIGALARSVSYLEPVRLFSDPPHGLAALTAALREGDVRALVVIGGNPSYDAPADAEFSRLIRQVPLTMYSGLYVNETAHDTRWMVPSAHYLESWGDARATDGTASIVQPLIAPLYGGRSVVDLLAFFAGDDRASHDVLRDFWQAPERLPSLDRWRDALRRGVIDDTAASPISVTPVWSGIARALERETVTSSAALEIAFVPDPSVHDGRFSNNGWLQEMPDPITKITWDNAALMSAATASRIGIGGADVIELTSQGRQLRAPAFIAPGIVDDLIVLPFGYGRQGSETIARGVGANGFLLWTSQGFVDTAVTATPAAMLGTRLRHEFAVTASHWSLEGRPILLEMSLDHFRADPRATVEHKGPAPALYGAVAPPGRQWAMAIDLSVCTGCSACVVACQAENNVPVVGKRGVQEGREMHWLRIDRYLAESTSATRMSVLPMLCQHCEAAPCEYVCPVNATVHSPDGLNEMTYNRCVGTRFCSNNCPYKVRRFNWYNYTADTSKTEQMVMNPDVTVRDRGVMEKCTFCVQRIRRADIDAALTGTTEPYARLQTACQQACPTRAIVFGSIADPQAQVTADAQADQSYQVLHDLGTRPRVHYLARLRNVNPALGEKAT